MRNHLETPWRKWTTTLLLQWPQSLAIAAGKAALQNHIGKKSKHPQFLNATVLCGLFTRWGSNSKAPASPPGQLKDVNMEHLSSHDTKMHGNKSYEKVCFVHQVRFSKSHTCSEGPDPNSSEQMGKAVRGTSTTHSDGTTENKLLWCVSCGLCGKEIKTPCTHVSAGTEAVD